MLRIISIKELRRNPESVFIYTDWIKYSKYLLFKIINLIKNIIKISIPLILKNKIRYYLIFIGKKNKNIFLFDDHQIKIDGPININEKNIFMIGGSSVFIKNNKIFFTERADIHRDRFAEEYRGFFRFTGKSLYALTYSCRAEVHGPTLNLMSGVALNYAHWVSECLPRLQLFIETNKDVGILNILVNENIPKSMLESIEVLVGNLFDVNVVEVPNAELIFVSNSYLSIGVGYCQFEPRKVGIKPFCYFSEDLLMGISQGIIKNVDSLSKSSKLYLERNSKYRFPINQQDAINLLKRSGFRVIAPETFSFVDQVREIAGADFVVAPTGASLANCIFARRGCHVFILINDSEQSFLDYWTNFLSFNTLNISYVVCKGLNQDPHSSYNVDLNNLSLLINQNHAT